MLEGPEGVESADVDVPVLQLHLDIHVDRVRDTVRNHESGCELRRTEQDRHTGVAPGAEAALLEVVAAVISKSLSDVINVSTALFSPPGRSMCPCALLTCSLMLLMYRLALLFRMGFCVMGLPPLSRGVSLAFASILYSLFSRGGADEQEGRNLG